METRDCGLSYADKEAEHCQILERKMLPNAENTPGKLLKWLAPLQCV